VRFILVLVLSMINSMLLFSMVYSDIAKNHSFDHFSITAILLCLVHMCTRNNKEIDIHTIVLEHFRSLKAAADNLIISQLFSTRDFIVENSREIVQKRREIVGQLLADYYYKFPVF
jgi:hypothetical protein